METVNLETAIAAAKTEGKAIKVPEWSGVVLRYSTEPDPVTGDTEPRFYSTMTAPDGVRTCPIREDRVASFGNVWEIVD